MTQVDGAGSIVRLEVIFDGAPKLARRLVWRHGEVEDGLGDGAVQQCADAAVVLDPNRINWVGRSPINVLEQPELATHGNWQGRRSSTWCSWRSVVPESWGSETSQRWWRRG